MKITHLITTSLVSCLLTCSHTEVLHETGQGEVELPGLPAPMDSSTMVDADGLISVEEDRIPDHYNSLDSLLVGPRQDP